MATINDESIEKLPTIFLWLWVLFLIRTVFVGALMVLTFDAEDPDIVINTTIHSLDIALYLSYFFVFFYSWEHYTDDISDNMKLRITSYIAAFASIIKMATTIMYRLEYTIPQDLIILSYYLIEIATWLVLAVFFFIYANRFKQKGTSEAPK